MRENLDLTHYNISLFFFVQNNELKEKLRLESDANIKLKKVESDLVKAQAIAEHSIKELNEKNRLLANAKVCNIGFLTIVSYHNSYYV